MFFTTCPASAGSCTLIRDVPAFSYTLNRRGCACAARSSALKPMASKKPYFRSAKASGRLGCRQWDLRQLLAFSFELFFDIEIVL